MSKIALCRNFLIKRAILIDTLIRFNYSSESDMNYDGSKNLYELSIRLKRDTLSTNG